MSKRFLITVAVVLVVGAVGVLLVREYTDPKHDRLAAFTEKDLATAASKMNGPAPITQSAPERIEPDRKVRLALGSIGLADEQQNRNVSDLVLAQLTGANGLELVERQALDAVLHELQLSASGLVRAKDAVRAGKLLRADWFLLGTPAVVNGTNVAVIRIVDARTGVMRDAAMIPSGVGAPALVSRLAAFVRQSRQDAADPKAKTYLAIGSFEDLSLNSRQAAMPRELRSYLTAAFQSSGVAMLEREFVNTLLREVYLDLAGLTEESVTTAPKPMQSAYWLVDGFYQSYETTNLQVELVLNVRRVLARNHRVELRDKPGEPLFRRVKVAIDRVMEQDKAGLVFSRMTEMQAQLATGKELAGVGNRADSLDYVWVSYDGYKSISENEMARRVRNVQEAVRAFETVLLLDPPNREARMCLATCFRRTLISRQDEARDYYREIIDSPTNDRWSDVARQALLHSFQWSDPDSRRRWFENAAQSTANAAAAEFYQDHSKRAEEDTTIQRAGSSKAEELAEVRLFEYIESFNNLLHNKGGKGSFALGMDDFTEVFGKDRALAARRLVELYPKMKSRFPDAAPYLLTTIVTFQVETNAPIIAEFERMLDWCAEHPDKVVNGGMVFWSHIRYEPYDWALKHKLTALAVKILETISRAASVDQKARENQDGMALAYGYLALERWKDALGIFESYTNQPVYMGNSGPWGRAFSVVLTSKQASLCREKLGLPPVIDPREFDLGEPSLCLHDPSNYWRSGDSSVFATTPDGLWIGLNDQVMHLDFNLKTNFAARMSTGSFAPLSALCVGVSNVWIGTAGDGLFELDKSTRKIQRFTEKDGLMMNYVSGLHFAGDTLWIGYGNESGGGLGRLDLNTRRFTSFTASLSSKAGATEPPRRRVTEIRGGPAGDVWFIAGSTLSKYRPAENAWEAQPNQNGGWVGCFALDSERLIETRVAGWIGIGIPSGGTLELRSLRDGRRQRLLEAQGLPSPPTTLMLHDRELWAGGVGFVALVDVDANQVKKLAYVPTRTVDQIQIAGGYLWVQFGKHIYRASLGDVR